MNKPFFDPSINIKLNEILEILNIPMSEFLAVNNDINIDEIFLYQSLSLTSFLYLVSDVNILNCDMHEVSVALHNDSDPNV